MSEQLSAFPYRVVDGPSQILGYFAGIVAAHDCMYDGSKRGSRRHTEVRCLCGIWYDESSKSTVILRIGDWRRTYCGIECELLASNLNKSATDLRALQSLEQSP